MKKAIGVELNISFVFYLTALIALLFVGSRAGYLWSDLSLIDYVKKSSNFIPFKTISTYISAMFDGSINRDIPIKNLFGNFALFLPMGIYLPYYIIKMNKIRVFIISMTIMLFIIEAIQIVARRGSFDIDDFILNMAGALIGFTLWKTSLEGYLFNQGSK